ncbi:MAG: hypothetical protein ACRYFK_05625 [Janthinobacterium lividum]
MTHKTKWLVFAPTGLLVIGAGACLVGWATTLKNRGATTGRWVAAGTAALGVLNAGVSLFGRGAVEQALYEMREKPLAAAPTYHTISQL